jgi:hypothetical protein
MHRVGYLVVTTDRGLCGGLNINLFRTLLREFRQWHDQGVEIDACRRIVWRSPGHRRRRWLTGSGRVRNLPE